MATTVYNFETPGNYTYDSDESVIDGELDIRPQYETFEGGNASFHANYTVDEDANWSLGSPTGTLVNGATVAGGYLVCSGAGSGATYSDVLNFGVLGNIGTINIVFKTGYSGSPANEQVVFDSSVAAGNFANSIIIYHLTNGNLKYYFTNSGTGGLLIREAGAFSPTAGVDNEIELCFNLTAGSTRFFLEGNVLGIEETTTGTRSNLSAYGTVGNSRTQAHNSDLSIKSVLLMSTVRHTANYTPSDNIPATKYFTTPPDVLTNASFKSTDILSITEDSTLTGSDSFEYVFNVGGVDKWLNGSTLETSSGYPESNTEAEINANPELFVTARSTVKMRTYSISADGTTTPVLNSLTVDYNTALEDPTMPGTVELEGFAYLADGVTPNANQEVRLRPYKLGFINEGIFQTYRYQTVTTTDADGFLNASFAINPSTTQVYELRIGSQSYKIDVSDRTSGDTIDIKDLAPLVEA